MFVRELLGFQELRTKTFCRGCPTLYVDNASPDTMSLMGIAVIDCERRIVPRQDQSLSGEWKLVSQSGHQCVLTTYLVLCLNPLHRRKLTSQCLQFKGLCL